MSENSLFKVTALIWTSYTIVMTILLTSADATTLGGEGIVIIAIILSIAAAAATTNIWQETSKITDNHTEEEKAKRNEFSRIERLARLMNEDDIVELETVLKQREYDALRRDDSH